MIYGSALQLSRGRKLISSAGKFFPTPLPRMLILQLALQGVLTLRNAPEFAPGFTQILPQRRLSLACWLGLPLLVSA